MEQDRIKLLQEIVLNKEYNLIISSFSFEERKYIVKQIIDNNPIYVFDDFIYPNLHIPYFSNLFTSDEANYLVNNYDSLIELVIVTMNLEDSIKLSIINKISNTLILQNELELYSMLIASLKNDSLKVKYLNNKYISNEIVISTLSNDTLKEEYLSTISDDYERFIIISSLTSDEDIIKYLDTISNDIFKVNIIISLSNDSYKINYLNSHSLSRNIYLKIITSLSDNSKINYLNSDLTYEEKTNLILSIRSSEIKLSYIDYINDYDNLRKLYTSGGSKDIVRDKLFSLYASKYNIKLDRIYILYQIFGNNLIDYLDNKNIIRIFKFRDIDFTNILNFIEETKLSKDNINNSYNSLLQRKFGIDNSSDINIYNSILNDIYLSNNEELENKINSLVKGIKINRLLSNKIFTEYDIISIKNNLREYILELCNHIYSNNDVRVLSILRLLCNNYLSNKREEYQSNVNINEMLILPKRLNKNRVITKVLKELSISDIIKIINTNYNLFNEEKELLDNPYIVEECIKYKKDYLNYQEGTISKELLLNKHLKLFNNIMNKLYDNNLLDKYQDESLYEYYIPEINSIEVLSILSKVNTYSLINIDDKLIKVLKDYGLLSWGNIFDNLLKDTYLDYNEDTVVSLINNYASIKEKIGDSKDNLISYLELASTYLDDYNIARTILGNTNYNLIKTNPPSNRAKNIVGNARIYEALNYIIYMFNRRYISIPPFKRVFTVNNKDITVSVGNITDMDNLTCGEVTGSCARIGGNGADILDMSLRNENAFTILFKDKDMVIAKVFGFRNGNTIFLNELRKNNQINYSNEDIALCCKLAMDSLIDSTKNSKNPIDNVVISSSYVMENYLGNSVKLDISKVINGLGVTYTNILNNPILLSTNNKSISLGESNRELYPVLRNKPVVYDNGIKAVNAINRLNIINSILTNSNPVIYLEEDIKYAVIGDDFYIFIDKNNQVNTLILSTNNYDYAKQEVDSYIGDIVKKNKTR